MAEPQPETPLSNNMCTALDIVGQTQLAHVGGYRDKSRLGVAMGNSGEKLGLERGHITPLKDCNHG